jgi:hypothetical protein
MPTERATESVLLSESSAQQSYTDALGQHHTYLVKNAPSTWLESACVESMKRWQKSQSPGLPPDLTLDQETTSGWKHAGPTNAVFIDNNKNSL